MSAPDNKVAPPEALQKRRSDRFVRKLYDRYDLSFWDEQTRNHPLFKSMHDALKRRPK